MRYLFHVFHLGVKELLSLARDPVLIFLIVYSFTFSIYTPSKSAVMDVRNASIAIVDEDDSEAARDVRDAMLPPLFRPADRITFQDINRDMDSGKYTFVVNIPPEFQSDLERNARPDVQLITDATAMSQAGRGPSYIQQIINHAVLPYWEGRGRVQNQPVVQLETRARFNPNMMQGLVRGHQPGDQQHLGVGDLPHRRGCAARARARQHRAPARHAAAPVRTDVRENLGQRACGDRGGDGVAVPGRHAAPSACRSRAPSRCSH